jgi:hypothetical protein
MTEVKVACPSLYLPRETHTHTHTQRERERERERERDSPSLRASITSFVLTFRARKRIDKFCAFLGSIILMYWTEGSKEGASFLLSFLFWLVQPNKDSIFSSLNLVSCYKVQQSF